MRLNIRFLLTLMKLTLIKYSQNVDMKMTQTQFELGNYAQEFL